MVNEIDKFLDERNVADPMRSAFLAYCRSLYSSRYLMRSNGDTIKLFMDRMNEDQVKTAWNEFLSDIKNILPTVN